MRDLPPFDALVAFEAVLRHGSMIAAAAELGVTQSAVSHRLRRLEAFVGTPLFLRLNPGLAPTAAGKALAEGLVEVLAGMAGMRARCRAAAAPARLRVGVGAALAQHWLVRRLPAFATTYPEIDVELALLTSCGTVRAANLDVRLLWLPEAEARASSTQYSLLREKVFPVCRPELLPSGRPLAEPQALVRLPLLHKGRESGPDAAPEWTWRTWFARLGLGESVPRGLRFDDIGPAIGGALEGTGVVLGRSLLCADALMDGRLARVLPSYWDVPCSKVHVATWSVAGIGDSRIHAFVRWIGEAAEGSIASTMSVDDNPGDHQASFGRAWERATTRCHATEQAG